MLLALSACSRKANAARDSDEAIKQKLDRVLQEMTRLADHPADKEALAMAKPFVDIQGLDMDVVGFAVPRKEKHNRVHLSFTLEYFQNHDIETLARQALNDWWQAISETPQQR